MGRRFWRRLAVTAKMETTYGTDAAPTGAANGMVMTNVTLNPLQGEEVSRELMLAYFGAQAVRLVGNYVELVGSVELAGAGAAGTAPAYGPLLRACGMSETIVAATSVTYAPVTASQESVSAYVNFDGVNHKLLGAKGTWSLSMAPKQIPRIQFTLRGLWAAPADLVTPAVPMLAWKDPLTVGEGNTTTWSLHGTAGLGESFALDFGNTVEVRNLVGADSIEITDRSVTGTMVNQADNIAAKDWFGIAKAHTRGPLSIVHGITAGNIVAIAAPQVQLGRPSYGNTQGITNLSLPLTCVPNAGDDELTLVVR
ncbi:phage tail tube protein [Aquabacter cavernae]|uniref:phage tail tube protein n=1 Tax=Aquabacter cavernae TaxID=2496029 RepID=UPI000F8F4462|nr:phage tail tube protein [Aquabacter cavernae]